MGKKLDRLLGKGFRASKFKPLLKLSISRATILQNQRRVRVSQSRSDVAHLLRLGHHDRVHLRAEEVIREQNMLDVYAMVEGYCSLLVERVNLIEQDKFCPEELKEAMSSLIFVAPRCGDLPELHEVYRTLASRYGREFVAQSVELRNGCAVSPKIIQKLSARRPPLEIRTKLIRDIASENGIFLPFDDTSDQEDRPSLGGPNRRDGNLKPDRVDESDSLTRRMEFKDVADAAQTAFESAAYAAAAARAAVELSRSRSQSLHRDHQTSAGSQREELRKGTSNSDTGTDIEGTEDETESNRQGTNTEARHLMDEGGKAESGSRDGFSAISVKESRVPRLDLDKKPISLRTKHFRGYQ